MKKGKKLIIVLAILFIFSLFLGASVFCAIYAGEFGEHVLNLIITVILFSLFVFIMNKKMKEKIVGSHELGNKIFLPAVIIVPIILMMLLGSCMKYEDNDKDDSSSSEIVIETTEKPTEPVTEEITEEMTELATSEPEHNTSDYVDYIARKAKEDAETADDEDIQEALEWLKNNTENYFKGNENMENTMYYGELLEYKYKDTGDDLEKIGWQAFKTVKYVYRGAETVLDDSTHNNLMELKEMLESYGVEEETEPEPVVEEVEEEQEVIVDEPIYEEPQEEVEEVIEDTPVEEVVEEPVQEEEPVEIIEETEDPNAQIIVYRTKSGEKYHYENPCGKGTYIECTLSDALARGLGPCEKCVLH